MKIKQCTLMATSAAFLLTMSLPAQNLPAKSSASDSAANKLAQKLIGAIPRTFEQNMGQVQGGERFLSTGSGYMLSLSSTGATFSLRDSHQQVIDVRMSLQGADPNAMLTGIDEVAAKKNYLYGKDSAKWIKNVPSFEKVKVADALSGIDLLYYGSQQQLEYDFDIAAGIDPRGVTLKFDGAKSLKLDKDGNLIVETSAGSLQLKKPDAYQQDAVSNRTSVQAAYVIEDNGRVDFELGAYDHSRALVLDPVIQYATYYGGLYNAAAVNGNKYESGPVQLPVFGMATDNAGASYIYGADPWSILTPLSTSTQGSCPTAGCFDIFIMKLDPTKSGAASLVYTTLIPVGALNSLVYGATYPLYAEQSYDSHNSYPGSYVFLDGDTAPPLNAIALDKSGNLFFTGATDNPDYPTTSTGYATSCAMDPSDPLGQFCVQAMYISELSNDGTKLLYSTLINAGPPTGKSITQINPAFGQSIAVDGSDIAYVTGYSFPGFPITNSYLCTNVFGATSGCGETVAVKLDTTKSGHSSLIYAEEFVTTPTPYVVTDGAGNLYFASPGCFMPSDEANNGTTPVPLNGYQSSYSAPYHCIGSVTRLNSTGTPTYSTFIPGPQGGDIYGLSVDSDGRAYVGGEVVDQNTPTIFPIVNGFMTPDLDADFGYLMAFDTTKTGTGSLVYSTAIDTGSAFSTLSGNGCGSVLLTSYPYQNQITGPYLVNPLPGELVGSAYSPVSLALILNTKLTGLNSLTFSSYLTDGETRIGNATLNLQGIISLNGFAKFSVPSQSQTPAQAGDFVPTSNAYQSTAYGYIASEAVITTQFNPFFEAIDNAIPSGCLNLAPTSVAFGNEPVGSTTATQTVTLTNTSDVNLTISSIVASAGFTETNACSASLAPNASCTINTAFSPTTAGAQTGTLTFTNSDVGSPQVIALTGTGTQVSAPVVNLNPTSIAFGNQTVNTTSNTTVVALSNTGTAPLTISSISLTGTNPTDFADVSACGASLAINASCNIAVTFTPASATGFAASLSVADNATGSPHTVALSGTGIAAAPIAALSPGTLAFANTPVGSTATSQTLTLSNTGNAALSITGITVTGANPTDFAETNTCGTSLAASSTCSISVTFTPASATSFAATISVADNATGSPQASTLTGTGTAPQAVLSPTTVAFTNTTVGAIATAQSITLSNPGNAALAISGVSITGANPADFAVSTNTCGTSLASLGTCSIGVTFTPASAASFGASLSVSDNATGSPQTVALTGTGVAPAAPVATLSPTTLAFASTTAGSTAAAQTVTLSNTGNATLNISGISITGANPADFAETTTCGVTLAASASCTFSVTFTPASAATFTAILSVADNAAASPQTATLSGTGSAPVATDFSITSLTSAQSVQPGAIASFTFSMAALSGSYNSPIVMSIAGLPANTTTTFTPSTVTPGAAAATSVLSIHTPSLLASTGHQDKSPSPWFAVLLLVPLFALRRRTPWLACLLALGILSTLVTGCGGGYYGPQAQTYTLTVTGTSGTLQHSTTVTLTVQ